MNKNFEIIIKKVIQNEGGYDLHEVPGDRGGRTFAGIAENFWPDWEGWQLLDNGTPWVHPELTELVYKFYKLHFWDTQNLDLIDDIKVAYSVFDFCVNSGSRTGARLAQRVVGAKEDGQIGPITAGLINQKDPELFDKQFALEKMYRYAAIVRSDHSQAKFIGGWANRTARVEQETL